MNNSNWILNAILYWQVILLFRWFVSHDEHFRSPLLLGYAIQTRQLVWQVSANRLNWQLSTSDPKYDGRASLF